jgi:hypothetical protein
MKTRNAIPAARHFAALETLWSGPPQDNPGGLALWKRLRRVELRANRAATAQCNGEPFGGQPFRPDYLPDGSEGTAENPTPWETFCASIMRDAARAFGGTLPDGFRFNQDPRPGGRTRRSIHPARHGDGLGEQWHSCAGVLSLSPLNP